MNDTVLMAVLAIFFCFMWIKVMMDNARQRRGSLLHSEIEEYVKWFNNQGMDSIDGTIVFTDRRTKVKFIEEDALSHWINLYKDKPYNSKGCKCFDGSTGCNYVLDCHDKIIEWNGKQSCKWLM